MYTATSVPDAEVVKKGESFVLASNPEIKLVSIRAMNVLFIQCVTVVACTHTHIHAHTHITHTHTHITSFPHVCTHIHTHTPPHITTFRVLQLSRAVKMSKSRGNVINPDDVISKVSADLSSKRIIMYTQALVMLANDCHQRRRSDFQSEC